MDKKHSYNNVIILDLFGTTLNDISSDYRIGLEYFQKEILNDCTVEQLWAVAEVYRQQYMCDRTFICKEASMLKQLALFTEQIGCKADVPIAEERKEILKIHFTKKNRNPEDFQTQEINFSDHLIVSGDIF